RGRLAGRESYRCQLALEAVADALHRVTTRRQVVHGVTTVGLTDDHECQAFLRIDQLDISSGQRLSGCALDHALNAADEFCCLNRVDAGKQRSSREYR